MLLEDIEPFDSRDVPRVYDGSHHYSPRVQKILRWADIGIDGDITVESLAKLLAAMAFTVAIVARAWCLLRIALLIWLIGYCKTKIAVWNQKLSESPQGGAVDALI